MPAFIPKVYCGTCRKLLPYGMTTVVRIHDEKRRFIRVRCHGEETHLAFTDKAGQTVTVWPDTSDLRPESK